VWKSFGYRSCAPREAVGLPASKPRGTKRKKTERAEKSEKKKKKDKKGNLAIGKCWILCIWNCFEHVRVKFPFSEKARSFLCQDSLECFGKTTGLEKVAKLDRQLFVGSSAADLFFYFTSRLPNSEVEHTPSTAKSLMCLNIEML
jgi:hypothetical protein